MVFSGASCHKPASKRMATRIHALVVSSSSIGDINRACSLAARPYRRPRPRLLNRIVCEAQPFQSKL